MAVHVDKTIFDEHISFELYPGQWTDTFVYPLSYKHGLPPWDYAEAVRLLAPRLKELRKGMATLWVPVETPPGDAGLWYYRSVKERLSDLTVPVAVTQGRDNLPTLADFTRYPSVSPTPFPGAPKVDGWQNKGLSPHAVLCLQVLNRITVGFTAEIASLVGVSKVTARQDLQELEERGLVINVEGTADIDSHLELDHKSDIDEEDRPDDEEDRIPKEEKYSYWRITRAGVSFALRSIGVPPNYGFSERKERRIKNGKHRRISRMWSAWLRKAWPQAEIWAAWSEAWIPSEVSNPDGLAWGTYGGRETLFWLEVESGRNSGKLIMERTSKRFIKAVHYATSRQIRLVFTFLGMPWTIESSKLAFVGLPDTVAVIGQNWNRFGELPVAYFGHAVFAEKAVSGPT